MRFWVLLILAAVPSLASACDACRDADVAKQGFLSTVAAPPAPETPAAATPEAPKTPRERTSAGESTIGGTSELVPATKPRQFIRSFNELK